MSLATVLLLGAAQAAFLVALIARKKSKTLADSVLAAWVSVLGLHHLLYALHYQGLGVPSAALNLNAGVPLLQGPFLFIYVDTLTSGRRRLLLVDALHLLPFLGFATYTLVLLPHTTRPHSSAISVFHVSSWITAAILLSVPIYAWAAFRMLRRHDAEILGWHSERHGRDLAWLRRIVLALLGVWSVVILATLAPPPLDRTLGHQIMSTVTLFIYAIGYFGWRQFAVVDPEQQDGGDRATGKLEDRSPKYERSGLQERESEALVVRLEAHLEQDRPYLEPGLTLMQIAVNVGTTPNRLSQAINQGMRKNFHELINERRVADFKRRALDPQNRNRTLLSIAFDSGFSSKSSFNRVFKQLAGVSPRQYIQSQVDAQRASPLPPDE